MMRAAAAGFTLMEMVLALTLLAVLGAIGAPYMSLGAQAYNESAAAIDTLGKLRNASERLARELREIRLVTAGGNPLVFSKIDGESVTINVAPPTVTLAYASLPGVTPVLVDDLNTLTFACRESDGVTTTACTSPTVAFIEFELRVDPAPAGNPYAQRTRVALRNQP